MSRACGAPVIQWLMKMKLVFLMIELCWRTSIGFGNRSIMVCFIFFVLWVNRFSIILLSYILNVIIWLWKFALCICLMFTINLDRKWCSGRESVDVLILPKFKTNLFTNHQKHLKLSKTIERHDGKPTWTSSECSFSTDYQQCCMFKVWKSLCWPVY